MRQIYTFREVDREDILFVGEYGAKLGELSRSGIPIPPGFIVSSVAYHQFLKENNLIVKINHLLEVTNIDRPDIIANTASHIQKLIMDSPLNATLTSVIFTQYEKLSTALDHGLVNVITDKTAGDFSVSSHPEVQRQVHGDTNLILALKSAWASLFTPSELMFRFEHHHDTFRSAAAVIIQKELPADRSGVMLTCDPLTSDKSKILIDAILGLESDKTNHTVIPDHYEVVKQTSEITKKHISPQTVVLRRDKNSMKEVLVSPKDGSKQKLSDKEIGKLAGIGKGLEQLFFTQLHINWEMVKDELYITSLQPIHLTTISQNDEKKPLLPLLASGYAASAGIATGIVKIVSSTKDLVKVTSDDIVFLTKAIDEQQKVLKKAKAVVTAFGGKTSSFAQSARLQGIPAVVGVHNAASLLRPGTIVTIHGGRGEIYRGGLTNPTSKPSHPESEATATKVLSIVSDSKTKTELQGSDGIGDFPGGMLIKHVGIHPKKVISDGKGKRFSQTMAEMIATYCEEVSPLPLVYSFSNLSANEYRKLEGGREYETSEENPLLGFRGTYRLLHDPTLLNLELEALFILKNKYNIRNLGVTISHVRSVKEAMQIKQQLTSKGIYRSPSFKLWVDFSIPSLLFHFDKVVQLGIDGVSLHLQQLTSYLLAVDPQNADVSHLYNENDLSVSFYLEQLMKSSRSHNVPVNIISEAPSSHSTVIENAVRLGVASITVPTHFTKDIRKIIANTEKKLLS